MEAHHDPAANRWCLQLDDTGLAHAAYLEALAGQVSPRNRLHRTYDLTHPHPVPATAFTETPAGAVSLEQLPAPPHRPLVRPSGSSSGWWDDGGALLPGVWACCPDLTRTATELQTAVSSSFPRGRRRCRRRSRPVQHPPVLARRTS
ncbi:DUF6417 family protein [Streptomyces sp. TRM 70361]|uniref:DUF6417 family protein n=1 Tax=Streptomyces sp. TRM 70361 TaxID=3116553 RepID=UPI003FCD9639